MIDEIMKEFGDAFSFRVYDCKFENNGVKILVEDMQKYLKSKLLAYSKAEKIKLLDRLLTNEECCENCGNGIANVPSEYIQDELKNLKRTKRRMI